MLDQSIQLSLFIQIITLFRAIAQAVSNPMFQQAHCDVSYECQDVFNCYLHLRLVDPQQGPSMPERERKFTN